MTQEEKELLIKDLCMRLPYGVKIYHIYSEKPVRFNSKHLNQIGAVKILPYLRPMSSMTEEEENEYHNLCKHTLEVIPDIEDIYIYTYYDTVESIDWLNAHHFDYRSLIPMGLALEATEGMYNN